MINKFRGAAELLGSGLMMLQQLTGRPVYGVLPWREGLWLDTEDSLSLGSHGVLREQTPHHDKPGSAARSASSFRHWLA